MNNGREQSALPTLLDSKSVAAWLGVSLARLYTLINTAEFPCVHVSKRRLRFDPEELKEWLRERGWRGIT